MSERDADMFARRVILPDSRFEVVKKLIHSQYKINEVSHICNIHPSMLYGLYLESLQGEEASREYPKYAKFLLISDDSIKNIVFDPVEQNGIANAVEKIRHQYNILTA